MEAIFVSADEAKVISICAGRHGRVIFFLPAQASCDADARARVVVGLALYGKKVSAAGDPGGASDRRLLGPESR
jgi:hypothetical protein